MAGKSSHADVPRLPRRGPRRAALESERRDGRAGQSPAPDAFGDTPPAFRSYQDPVPDWSRPIIPALLLLLLVFGIRSSIAAARARLLERQRKRLADDMGFMQRVLVPDIPARLGNLSISAAYSPAEGPGSGGDFYDVFPLRGGRVGVIMGDVAGHGPTSLERSALVRYTVRAYVEAGLEPRMSLKLSNRVLGDDGQAFATVAVGVFDPQAGLLTYALAGHPPPLLLGAGVRGPVTACSSPPLGLGFPTGMRQTTVSLSEDAVACFFTDGLVEARIGDSLLGRENLEQRLVMLGPEADAAALLRQPVDRATDDRAICLVRLNGRTGRPPLHIEALEVEEGNVADVDVEKFLEACAVSPAEIRTAVATAQTLSRDSGATIQVKFLEDRASVEVVRIDPERFEVSELSEPRPAN